ncbi:MAG TPA: bifunctional oligoribonuclease/PAP phosphatase NrnA [Thermoanaerobaculaceae bacterium]|nr:bifunctional oligoribonuclease/PAP phosphatase NrnA [Thermoanaerobaculaceae bacterium]
MSEATRDVGAALARLKRATRVLVTSHSAPDGDALGSELGFAELAHALGVGAAVVNHDPHPATLGFLPGLETIAVQAELPRGFERDFDLAVLLECPGLDRPAFAGLDRLPILNIDHHLENPLYGEVNVVDEEAPAVGEMVLRMAESAGVAVTPRMATNLYAALVTDTGDFRYSNATPRAFEAGARLVAAGARPAAIAEALWEQNPARVVRLTAAVLATLELLAGGRLALVTCDRAMLEAAGAHPEDTENLVNIPRAIEGVRVAVFLKAFKDGAVRASLRSRGDLDVQAVARVFGGGGHRNAAGCTIPGTLAQARTAILAEVLPVVEPA